MNTIARVDASLFATARTRLHWLVYRPELSIETLAFAASLFFTAISSAAFFREIAATGALHGASGWLTAASLFVAITALNMILLCVLLNRWSAKSVLTVLLLATAAVAHFMNQYTVYFDDDMLRNILHTDRKESAELITSRLVWAVLAAGVVPALLVWRLRLRRRPLRRALLIRGACLVAALLAASGAMALSFQEVAALMRNHRDVRHLITPGNYLISLGRVALSDGADRPRPRTPVGASAHVLARAPHAKPQLVVLVIGETVRAQNWGLNGYARQTTPELARLAPINYRDVTACGSSTEVSLPCMFSPYGRAHYDKDKIQHAQSLLHVLEHAGIKTRWRDNQTGCKGVCEGLAFESFERGHDPQFCDGEGCADDVMLQGLGALIDRQPGDLVVVLHQLGNHGPSYYKRYPPRLRRFVPDCRTDELGDCSREQIVNAYDNAVLNTDEFVARTIHLLATRSSHDAAMIYVSDHGESLGEDGLYLHGVPYAIAPDTQIKVPMVMWLSPQLTAARRIDQVCLRQRAVGPVSHDNLFHSVLGLLQVATPEYQPAMDLFAKCKT